MPLSPFSAGTSSERERATRVGIARLAVGSSLLVTTGLSRRIFGVPAEQDTPAMRLVARLFGVRNIALGTWTLAARDQGDDARRLCYQVNAAVDAADVAVLALAAKGGLVRAAVTASVLGSAALLAWIDLLRDLAAAASDGR